MQDGWDEDGAGGLGQDKGERGERMKMEGGGEDKLGAEDGEGDEDKAGTVQGGANEGTR